MFYMNLESIEFYNQPFAVRLVVLASGRCQGLTCYKMKLGTSLMPHFRVILNGQSITEIIFMTDGHLQGFNRISTGKSIYSFILVTQVYFQCNLHG